MTDLREGAPPPRPRRKRAAKPAVAPQALSPDQALTAPATPARKRAKPKPPAEIAAPMPASAAAPLPLPLPPAPAPEAPAITLADVLLSQTGGDLEKLSRNLAEVMTRTSNVFATAFYGQTTGANLPTRLDPFDVQSALNTVWADLAQRPETLRDAHGALWLRYSEIWRRAAQQWMAGPPPESLETGRDKRFKDAEWRATPFFSLMRETYLATADWITGLVEQTEGVDADTKRKAAFFIKQAVDAASPSNFLMTNPVALRETLRSRGENLRQGLENLSEDLARGKGLLAITQTDTDAFRLGDNIATTPGKVIHRGRLIELIQYAPTTQTVYASPLLIFPPWINKFYILDLQARNSFIRWLVAQGHTVFVASWVNPDARLAEATFEDYMVEGVFEAVDVVREAAGEASINAVGYCIGGTLLASTLAYMARIGDARIQSATFFAAQMDFELAGELKVFTDDAAIRYLEERINAKGGFLDSQAMADTFNALRSNDLFWNYVVDNYYLGKRPAPFDLLFWNADQTRMPRALHLFYLKRFYHDNALAKGELVLGGERLDLGEVTIPVYMQAAREDHIAPAASVYRSARLFGGPVRYMLAGSGHIAGVINHPDANKYQHWRNDALPATLEEWRREAVETPGSWWVDWQAWLAQRSGPQVPARAPGQAGVPALGDAPGDYVRVRS